MFNTKLNLIVVVIKILYKYCGKLDSKSKSRHHKISSLTEDPASIFKALEESLGKNTSDFIDNLKKEFGECNRNSYIYSNLSL